MDTIKGFIEHIIFRNKENGYTVLNLLTQEESLTCVGFFKRWIKARPLRPPVSTPRIRYTENSLK